MTEPVRENKPASGASHGATACKPGGFSPRVTIVDGVVLAAIFMGMVYGIGRYGLYEPHEGHFAGVGYEMLMGHDWVTPKLNGAPYLNKPPLFYWMIASSYWLFGVSEWSARLPQALIGWLGVLAAWKWARELFGARAGRIAAGMLAVSAGWYLFSHQLLIDELLSTIYLASLYCIWRVAREPERRRNWVMLYVTIGLSILAKGLIGPILTLFVFGLYALIEKEKSLLRNCRPLMGLAIVAGMVLPWLILIELRNPGFLKYVIVNEHWNRIFGKRDPPDFEPVRKGVLAYLGIALVWLAPWALFLPQIACFGYKNASPSSGLDKDKTAAFGILGLGALLPTLLFVPVPTRLIYYSLPTLPAFAVLASGWWASLATPCYKRGRIAAGLSALLLGVPIALAGQMIVPHLKQIPDLVAAPQTLESIPGFALTIGAGLVCCGVLLLLRKTGTAMLMLCAFLLVGEAYNTHGFASFDRVRSSRRLVQALLPKAGPETLWISEGSLEIGAAGGMAFNLGLDGEGNPRHVYVMSDGPKRRPPSFPGEKPGYLIDKAKLAELWFSNKPAIYVTDFQRMGRDDPPSLPPGELHEYKFNPADNPAGFRRVFVNDAALKRFGL